ncbi:MAG: YggT family protein [Chloroflexi bacterium]|nr:YggT family protein [Chloroflexota bacterium]
MSELIIRFVQTLTTVLSFAIFARALLSWFPAAGSGDNPIVAMLYQITEPILAPLRAILPRVGMMDLTPMVAIILLQVIGGAVGRLA